MPVDYQKLYAFLVGQIDDTIHLAEAALQQQENSTLVSVGQKLKLALLTAEEIYLKDTDDESFLK